MNNGEVTAYNSKENDRRGNNAIRLGVIKEARYDQEGHPENTDTAWFSNEDTGGNYRGPLYRVEFGDHKLYWMPQLFQRAGKDVAFWPYEVGEQVLVLCVSGDPMQSFLLGSVNQDTFRPPVGWDDVTKDKRPWRETVHRLRYEDGRLWEYDRVLHRELTLFPDGTREKWWCQDTREEREKEGPSDKTGVPPRHWHHILMADQTDYEFIWDEDSQIHHRHWNWPDSAIIGEYTWDEQAQTHVEHYLQADGSFRKYTWNEAPDSHVHEYVYADGTRFSFSFSSPHIHKYEYSDGTVIQYDLSTHKLTATITGEVELTAQGKITATTQSTATLDAQGEVAVTSAAQITATAPEIELHGNVTVFGNLTVDGEVSGKQFYDTDGPSSIPTLGG